LMATFIFMPRVLLGRGQSPHSSDTVVKYLIT
jgi:hypothetical protein